jgi:dihydrofolate reductase
VTISLIIAAAANDVIGRDGGLPWHLPEDLRRFRELTTGHVVVLGRVTHESIVARLCKPLPRRTTIVVSRAARAAGEAAPPPGDGGGQVRWAASLESALGLARAAAAAAGGAEVFVGGGVSIYTGALPLAGRIYLTRVHAAVSGDRAMPAGWLGGFALVRREAATGPAAGVPYEFLEYERVPR